MDTIFHPVGTLVAKGGTDAAVDAFMGIVGQLGDAIETFGVVAPEAVQRASLQK
jgi:hypothetical protein